MNDNQYESAMRYLTYLCHAFPLGVGVYARGGRMALQGDPSVLPPAMADAMLSDRDTIAEGWEALAQAVTSHAGRLGERINGLGSAVIPPPGVAEEAMDVLFDLATGSDSSRGFLLDLVFSWDGLSVEDQNACAWIWHHLAAAQHANSPPA